MKTFHTRQCFIFKTKAIMIRSGFTDILSYFEDASFPVILLKTDLTVEYTNRQANNKFGKYFKNKEWYKEYLNKESIRKITTSILAGENVIITPPEVKDFSFLLFQPIYGKNGKPELVRLNIEILADINRRFNKHSPNTNLFRNIYEEMNLQLRNINLTVNELRRCVIKDEGSKYIEILKSSCNTFKEFVVTYDYIYSLMKSYNINEVSFFSPKEVIDKLEKKIPALTTINLLSGHDSLICNPQFFINTLNAIIEHIRILTGAEKIELKAYEEKEHFIFVIQAKKDLSKKIIFNYIQQFYLDLDTFKTKAEELGGNLISIESPNRIKVLYSIRKHIRADFSSEFNQESYFGEQYQI